MHNTTSYYHTLIVYPDDLIIDRFIGCPVAEYLDDVFNRLDCDYILSPVHIPDENKKIHIHCLLRCANKLTGNSFQTKLVDVLNGVMIGFAYSPTECVVSNPNRYLRYMLHLDNKSKQQFYYRDEKLQGLLPYDLFEFLQGVWDKEFYNAFTNEITEFLFFNACMDIPLSTISKKFGYALLQGKNLYLYNSLLKENDIKEKKRK